MIARRIHDGETAEQIGISEPNYKSRRETLERFLVSWNGIDFESSYAAWIKGQPEGMSNCKGCTEKPATSEYHKCNSCEQKLNPTTTEMVKSATRAFTEYVMSGGKKVSDEVHVMRWQLCESCSELIDGKRCRKCGCFMKIKTWLPGQHCILNKW